VLRWGGLYGGSGKQIGERTVGRRNRAWVAQELFGVINAFEWEIATPDDPQEQRRPSPARGRGSQDH